MRMSARPCMSQQSSRNDLSKFWLDRAPSLELCLKADAVVFTSGRRRLRLSCRGGTDHGFLLVPVKAGCLRRYEADAEPE